MKNNTKDMTENQLLYSDMVPVQKIHGERNGEIVSRIWKKKSGGKIQWMK